MIPGSANPLLLAAAAEEAAGYQISRSLRFNSSDSAYLSRTPASAGNRKTWTWAGWVKRAKLGDDEAIFSGGESNPITTIRFSGEGSASPDGINIFHYAGAFSFQLTTTAQYRDLSSWYHIVVALDTTQATESNRLKLYVNGEQVTAFDTATYPSLNFETEISNASTQTIARNGTGSNYKNGYLADIHFIDGQALDPTSFTEVDATTGQLVPIEYTGSYGTNGFHLPFSDNSTAAALGTDTSGNSNTWTVNNISVTAGSGNDSLVDTPTNGSQTDTGVGGEVRGNYCIGNWLNQSDLDILKDGNLHWRVDNTRVVTGTHAMSSGKWYWEATVDAIVSLLEIGIVGTQVSFSAANNTAPGTYSSGFAYRSNATKINNNSATSYGASFAAGDLIGVAFDADAGTITFYKNGSTQGTAFTGIASASYVPCVYGGAGGGNTGAFFNFGQRPFAYTAPSGFKALCTANLDDPVVAQPSTVMDVALYTGNGTSQTITGLDFQPDFVWIKDRSLSSDHALFDVVRGSTTRLRSNQTDAESTDSGYITSFNSDGFSIGSHAAVNYNTSSFVGWCWDAGSSTASNTDGSITSTVRANASAGFSIVTYTGTGANATVGHGLGVPPAMIIAKSRNNTGGDSGIWVVYHKNLTSATYFLYLNQTNGETSASTVWNSTAPTSSVFSIGTASGSGTASDHVAYCFAPVDGYSSFGSYTGNGSSDGPFVFTGMRPMFILFKNANDTVNWRVIDTARSTINVMDDYLSPNTSDAEIASSVNQLDVLSNGFKLRGTSGGTNGSGNTIIYAAFAENPFKYARAR